MVGVGFVIRAARMCNEENGGREIIDEGFIKNISSSSSIIILEQFNLIGDSYQPNIYK